MPGQPQSLLDMYQGDMTAGPEAAREDIARPYYDPNYGSVDMNMGQFFGLPRGDQEHVLRGWAGGIPQGNNGVEGGGNNLIERLWSAAPMASRERTREPLLDSRGKPLEDQGESLISGLLGPRPQVGAPDYYQTMTGQPAPAGAYLTNADQRGPGQPAIDPAVGASGGRNTGWRYLPDKGWINTAWPEEDIQAFFRKDASNPRAGRGNTLTGMQNPQQPPTPTTPSPATPAPGGWQKPSWWTGPWMGQ